MGPKLGTIMIRRYRSSRTNCEYMYDGLVLDLFGGSFRPVKSCDILYFY